MRKSRAELHLGWRAIPRPIRPSWREWKDIVRAFGGDPKRAVVALLAAATAKLERKLGNQ